MAIITMHIRIPNFIRLVLICIFAYFPLSITAQNKGRVLDAKTNAPLAGVSISSTDNILTITDDTGNFRISPLKDNDTIRFSYIGYKTLQISYTELIKAGYTIFLDKDEQSLSEVTVSASGKALQSLLQYKTLAPIPVGLYSFGAVLAEDKIYILGGDESFVEDTNLKAFIDFGESSLDHTKPGSSFLNLVKPNSSFYNYNNKIYVYDIKSDTWETNSNTITKRAYLNSNYFDGKIYSIGGKRLSKSRKHEYLSEVIEAYDIKRDTVFTSKVNPHHAINFASVVYEDNIIVMGGSVSKNANDQKVYSDKAYLFNLKTGLWYQLDDMPNAKETKSIIVDNSIYLIGGFHVAPLKEIESYDVLSCKWTSEANLLRAAERPGLTHHADIIYIFEAGCIQTYNISTKEVNLYKTDLPFHFAELFYSDSKLYVVGGFRQDEYMTTEPSAGIFTISLEEFKKTQTYNEQ